MTVWRLCQRSFTVLDGKGAAQVGGRWNSPGLPMVYTSTHLSLAILEVLVNLELTVDELPDDYVSIEIVVPDHLAISNLEHPLDLHDLDVTQGYGSQWLATGSTVALQVPSVVVPKEDNVCLNPLHPDFKQISTVAIEPFEFDMRFFSSV